MQEEFEDTKRGIQNPSIEKGQTTQWLKKKDKRTNNYRQNITRKTKDRVTRTPLKTNNNLQNITQKTKDRATRT